MYNTNFQKEKCIVFIIEINFSENLYFFFVYFIKRYELNFISLLAKKFDNNNDVFSIPPLENWKKIIIFFNFTWTPKV